MLVLTRSVDDVLCLITAAGERIDIKVVKVQGKQARLGIIAPDNVAVMREERLQMLEAAGADTSSSSAIRAIQSAYSAGHSA